MVLVFIFSFFYVPFRLAASAAWRPGAVITPPYKDGIEAGTVGRFAVFFIGYCDSPMGEIKREENSEYRGMKRDAVYLCEVMTNGWTN